MFPTDIHEIEILLRILILAPSALIWVVLLARIIGLRTFSKMTAFDFVATIATGSLMGNAATSTSWSAYWQAIGAMVIVLFTQAALAYWRQRSSFAPHVLVSEPIILYRDGEWNERALKRSRTTKADIWGKMRKENVLDITDVRAIILETTGDVSVLHGGVLSEEILTGVSKSSR